MSLIVDSTRNIGIVHLDADMSFKFFVSAVKWDIHRAKGMALEGLVVVIPEVRGFPPPDALSRKHMAVEWADGARDDMIEQMARDAFAARIRLAIVVPEHYIDRETIGVRIAAMHGLKACVTTTEQAALDWMDGSRPGTSL
jgi:hypothetical protein